MNDRRTTVELELRLPPGVNDKEVRRRLGRGLELRSKGAGQSEWLSCGVIAGALLGGDGDVARAPEAAPAAPESAPAAPAEVSDDAGSFGAKRAERRPAQPKPARKARRKAARKSRR